MTEGFSPSVNGARCANWPPHRGNEGHTLHVLLIHGSSIKTGEGLSKVSTTRNGSVREMVQHDGRNLPKHTHAHTVVQYVIKKVNCCNDNSRGVFGLVWFFPSFLMDVWRNKKTSCLHSLSAAGNMLESMLEGHAVCHEPPDSVNNLSAQGFHNEVRPQVTLKQ